MLKALRSVRTQQPNLFSNSLPTRKPSAIRFAGAAAGPNQHADTSDKMDKKEDTKSKAGDSMSCFGEGYATRCDEEGFGGIYSGNQSVGKDTEEKIDHGDAREYDDSQGCEVKEKEKARHQSKVAA